MENENLDFIHVPTQKQLEDIFTKPLDHVTFSHLRGELGVTTTFGPLRDTSKLSQVGCFGRNVRCIMTNCVSRRVL
jgi:hypothetical protein